MMLWLYLPEMMKTTHETEGVQSPKVLLDSAEVKERLGLSDSQLTRMRSNRRIGYCKRGGRILYAEEEVQRVLRESEVPALRPVVEIKGE